ncbi:hypothetical protein [Saccharothrix yanglingensis]|uniref:hypothetical protein n=1 Tax=Saccharothrix yanglingensis TaxID=659496 RepID=UPI0027D2807C|nr:hypothetical protein [Saccharothrix yanglingensis]
MGWSNTAMAARYQHITAAIRRAVAQRVGGLLRKPSDAAGGTSGPDADEGAAGVAVPA